MVGGVHFVEVRYGVWVVGVDLGSWRLVVRDPHAVHHHLTDGVAGRDEKGGRRQDISSKRDDADVNGWRICPELGGGWWVAHQGLKR